MQNLRSSVVLLSIIVFILLIGCTTKPTLKMPDPLPPIVKEYKHFTLQPMARRSEHNLDIAPTAFIKGKATNTGVYLNEGDFYSILMDDWLEQDCLSTLIDDNSIWAGRFYLTSPDTGYVNLDHNGTCDQYQIDGVIIVWEKEDYAMITEFFEQMKELYPNNQTLNSSLILPKV